MKAIKPKIECLFVALMVLMLAGDIVSAATARLNVSVITRRDLTGATNMEVATPDLGPVQLKTLPSGGVVVQLGKLPQGGEPGDPMLPYSLVRLLMPPDADLVTVKAKLSAGVWEELPGEYEIAPAPPAATTDADKPVISWGTKDKSIIINGRDSAIYGRNAYFPTEAVQVVSVGQFRQWKLVEFRVWMAAYNPVKKTVRILRNAVITPSVQRLPANLAVGLSSSTPPVLPGAAKFASQLLAEVDNPQDFETFYGGLGGAPGLVQADYVIITTSTIVTNSTKLASFKTDKQTQGYTVKTVVEGAVADDTHYISGASCDVRANNIRSWLQANYLNDGTEYVLLIGDPNSTFSNQTVPMKMCWPRSTETGDPLDYRKCPTDMYFAELSGNWDVDANGLYGEFHGDYGAGGCDKFCEVKVGRIPVYDANYVSLDAILQKCIDYRNAGGDLSWQAKVLLPAAISNFGPQDNQPYGNYLGTEDYSTAVFGNNWGQAVKGLAPSYGFSSYTLYEKSGLAFPATACNASLTPANVKAEWPNKYGFVTWWGHGSQTGVYRRVWVNESWAADNITQFPAETSDTVFFQSTDCAVLDDNSPSFVVQVSCNNGYPENSINLGYSLLKQGAIGTISGTRVTWYALGSWNTGKGASVGDNASYGYYCFDRMAGSGDPIGDALVWCRGNFGTGWTDGASWMNMVEFSLYGDPSLSIGFSPIKWEQPPDETSNGIDIRCDRRDGITRILADDFNCVATGPITRVTLWGSWYNDIKGQIKKVHLSIHSNDPNGPNGWSEPNELLWERDFYAGDIDEILYSDGESEWFWDPTANMPTPIQDDHNGIWQYDISIDLSSAFVQQGDPCNPVIYWLDAWVELKPDSNNPRFGWKTSSKHWNDDAVWWDANTSVWKELRYPSSHLYEGNSIDLAFVISTQKPKIKKLLEPNTKWSQPPIEIDPTSKVPTYCGWDEESHNRMPSGKPWKVVADDFHCIGSMPVTSIHWWGSFHGWEWAGNQGQLPPVLPAKWWIGFWSNVPAGAEPYYLPYSYPEMLRYSITIPAARVDFEEVGSDAYYDCYPTDICYQYHVDLEPNEVFWQDDFNDATYDNTYWISIVAEYNMPSVYYPWGWKTRPWSWKDDAVTFRYLYKPVPPDNPDPCQITPIVDPCWGESFDMAFELDTAPNYIKWEQIYNGREDWWLMGWWKFDEGSGSIANDSSGNHRNGVIHGNPTWQTTGSPVGNSGYLKFDGSGDYVDVNCPSCAFLLPIYTVSAWFRDDGVSNPNDPNRDIISVTNADANHGLLLEIRGNNNTLRYLHRHPFSNSIGAGGPAESIYTTATYNDGLWHHAAAVRASDNSRVLYVDGQQVASDSNATTAFDAPVSVILGALFSPNYVYGGRWWNGAIDDVRIYSRALSATEVTALYNFGETGYWPHYEDEKSMYDERYPSDARVVADDWRCLRRTPVTSIVWWGSYIGYGYEACSQGPFMSLPVPPDKFRLKMWTDVAADPCNPGSYSHPGEVIWQYDANEYDEVFVGYDKYPEGEPNEPVFRYSVRLPDANWFHQPDYSRVFWFSVQAIYNVTNEPTYDWGWTNHKHVFNDDAVRQYRDPNSGQWVWDELFDQTGASEDMSFILFTEPNACNRCADYNIDGVVDNFDLDVFTDNWLWTGQPGGFNSGDLNCDGTVKFDDFAILALVWLDGCP